MDAEHHGSCHCGAVAFVATGPLGAVGACHCTQCRRWSGHHVAATSVPHARFRLTRDGGLAWYRSSGWAQRGFCRDCGASLFWQPDDEARIAISAGAFDGPTGLSLGVHHDPESAGDYYAPEGPPPPPDPAPPETLTGACLCGAIRFTLPGPAGPITGCHCSQCRKLSGHFAASFDADEAAIIWLARGDMGEYPTPAGGRRGFCRDCGSSLWFRGADGSFSVEAGVIEGRTGGRLAGHIFIGTKGDYYALADGLPQWPGYEDEA